MHCSFNLFFLKLYVYKIYYIIMVISTRLGAQHYIFSNTIYKLPTYLKQR